MIFTYEEEKQYISDMENSERFGDRLSKSHQVRGKKSKVKKKKPRDKVWGILDKAWKVQSKGIRSHGRCVGCGSVKTMIAGHLVHGGRGKAWNMVDFNEVLPCDNIFCQCSWCNTRNPDGNGLLRQHFNFIYFELATIFYDDLKSKKQQVWRPTEEEAKAVLEATIKRYGKSE